jgi:hypothetical protein
MATLLYFQQGDRGDLREEESASFDEALDSAAQGVHHGFFEPHKIVDGPRVVVGDELEVLVRERQAQLGLDGSASLNDCDAKTRGWSGGSTTRAADR